MTIRFVQSMLASADGVFFYPSESMSSIFPGGAKIDVTADSYEAAEAIALRWSMETTQLEPGRYHFCIQAVHTPHLQLARSWRSLGTQLSGKVPEGSVVLAFSLNPDARVQFRGQAVHAGDLIVQEDTRGLDFSFMGKIDIISISVSRAELNRRAQLHWGKPFPSDSRTGLIRFKNAKTSAQAKLKIARAHAQWLKMAELLALDGPARQLEDLVLDALFAQLEDHTKARGSAERHRAAKRAAAYIFDHCRDDLSMAQLCHAVRATRRTLHLGFVELYGTPPIKYLQCVRLCKVRRELTRSENAHKKVTSIATTWGFNHLGRFAGAYRKFFGELPSERDLPRNGTARNDRGGDS